MTQYLGLNISDELAEAIAARTIMTKETKTEIVVMSLEKELGIQKNSTLGDRVEKLEAGFKTIDLRITSIEARLNES